MKHTFIQVRYYFQQPKKCPSTLYDNNVYHFHQRFIALLGSGLAEGNALLHRVSSSMEKASLGLF